jgi:hypothetical protein
VISHPHIMHVRSPGAGSALIMAHRIDRFCMSQLVDARCPEAAQIGRLRARLTMGSSHAK